MLTAPVYSPLLGNSVRMRAARNNGQVYVDWPEGEDEEGPPALTAPPVSHEKKGEEHDEL